MSITRFDLHLIAIALIGVLYLVITIGDPLPDCQKIGKSSYEQCFLSTKKNG